MPAGKVALFVVPGPGGQVQLSERDDDDLMLLVCGGLRAAFDELVRRHRPRLLGVAMRYVNHRGLAHDVTQNTFLEVYRGAAHYQPRGSFRAYLYRVQLNQCHMVQRAARSEARLLAAAAIEPTQPHGESAEDRILAEERERRVQRALDRLSEKLRAPVVLRYSGDLSYQEIADVLDLPLGTTKRRLFDALAKLRTLFLEEP